MTHKTTYVIGDLQGCLDPLKELLVKIDYDPARDQLWFTGDLVNRGPQSLATLRFVKNLANDTVTILGNHDLTLLAASEGVIQPKPKDTYQEILQADDKDELLAWLRSRPILYHDLKHQVVMTHAGIYPLWDLKQAKQYAHELEQVIRGDQYAEFFHNMFGNQPAHWQESLQGWDRLRFFTNAFTRMRFCTPDGGLDLTAKEGLADHPALIPWFEFPNRIRITEGLIFGHWAALTGKCHIPNIFPLDTGCVWGNCLTAYCLESKHYITVDCSRYLR